METVLSDLLKSDEAERYLRLAKGTLAVWRARGVCRLSRSHDADAQFDIAGDAGATFLITKDS